MHMSVSHSAASIAHAYEFYENEKPRYIFFAGYGDLNLRNINLFDTEFLGFTSPLMQHLRNVTFSPPKETSSPNYSFLGTQRTVSMGTTVSQAMLR